MPVEYLIDGYNLLHNAGLARGKLRPGEFEKMRDKLLKRLQLSLTEEERVHTTIVFDAQYAPDSDRRPMNIYGMQVLFSPRGRQADDLIEILLSGNSTASDITVISSDHRLHRAARASRAKFMSSDAFLVELDDRREASSQSEDAAKESNSQDPKDAFGTGKIDSAGWLEEFGDISVDSIEAEVTKELSRSRKSTTPEKPDASPTLPSAGNSTPQKGVNPLIEKSPQQVHQKQHRPPPAVKSEQMQTDDAEEASMAELDFWRQRIQDLKDDPSLDFQPRRQTKQAPPSA
ncbi:NYN domain-containing protein [Planctomicrobium sp. SH668]|uniref:NYN domain-containing protein n=1 Tax=Planctomicrobium sp. SH668 TaxID=3448126 RepID=UPI003F5B7A4F